MPLPGANVIADDRTLLIPDVLAVTPERAAQGGLGVTPQEVLLAVEVESPSTRRNDRTLKRSLYDEWGVPYALIDPQDGSVTHHTTPPWAIEALDDLFR